MSFENMKIDEYKLTIQDPDFNAHYYPPVDPATAVAVADGAEFFLQNPGDVAESGIEVLGTNAQGYRLKLGSKWSDAVKRATANMTHQIAGDREKLVGCTPLEANDYANPEDAPLGGLLVVEVRKFTDAGNVKLRLNLYVAFVGLSVVPNAIIGAIGHSIPPQRP